MKKSVVAFFAFLLCALTICSASAAQNYTYFDVVNTNYPEDSIISDNVVFVGGVYYMSQKDGGLFYSHDAVSWNYIDGSDGAKIISDKKSVSDSLIVFYNGYLARSYDGADFTLLKQFLPDTVIHFDNGLYVAYEKNESVYASLYYSFDASIWSLVSDSVTDGRFTIDRYSNMFVLNGINTASGTVCAVIAGQDEKHIVPCSRIDYDSKNNLYIYIKNDGANTSLSYAPSPDAPASELSLPNISISHASYYDGSFYIASSESGIMTDVYKYSGSVWEWTDTFYIPAYKTLDKNGAAREIYLWHNTVKNTSGALVKNESSGSSSIVIADGLTLNLYGSSLGIATSEKPVNLLSYDGVTWHQADTSSAFSILNEGTLRGSCMFVDRTSDHTVLKPKGNPYSHLEERGVEVRIDGHYIAFDQPPEIINDRVLVPLRAISEALGASVQYEAASRMITLQKGGNTITMTVGDDSAHIAYYDGASYDALLDSPSIIVNDRTLVPIRFIGEAFGMNIDWESGPKTVWITSK